MRKKIVKPVAPERKSPVKKLALQYPQAQSANLVPKLKKQSTMPLTARAKKTKMTLEASPKSRGSVQVMNGQHYLKSNTMGGARVEKKIPRDLNKFKRTSPV